MLKMFQKILHKRREESTRVEPVVYGEWKKLVDGLDGRFYCSVCGHIYDTADGNVNPIQCEQKRCYWCGSHMYYNR